uniref:Uncharacterized protein n=1 Tax=Opuntia streptacantha TaxID=393608 RepID=A0A7C9D653_OPUST
MTSDRSEDEHLLKNSEASDKLSTSSSLISICPRHWKVSTDSAKSRHPMSSVYTLLNVEFTQLDSIICSILLLFPKVSFSVVGQSGMHDRLGHLHICSCKSRGNDGNTRHSWLLLL